MLLPWDWSGAACGVPIRRWCRAGTLPEDGRPQRVVAQPRRLERHILAFRTRQHAANARSLSGKALIGLVAHQHVSGSPPIRDDDRPLVRRAFGAPNILVEFATGQSGHFGASSSQTSMILQILHPPWDHKT